MSSAAGGRRRLALYGGAFDPIHNGHLATIALILNSGAADEVLVIPSGDRPDKPNTIAAQHRVEPLALTQRLRSPIFRPAARLVLPR